MADNIALMDAETLAALKVLRGGTKRDLDKEFASGLAKEIVGALSEQKESSSSQTTALIEAVREQTAALQKLTDLLAAKQKTTVVVVNKNGDNNNNSSVASTAAETQLETVGEDEETAALVATAIEAASKAEEEAVAEEAADEAPEAAETASSAEEEPPPPVFRGPWGFVESGDAGTRRARVSKSAGTFRYLEQGEEVPKNAFVPITGADKAKHQDALFGSVSSDNELTGDSFGEQWDRMRSRTDQYGKLKPPLWSASSKKSVRSLLPQLAINGESTIALNSGVYYLTVKYEAEQGASRVEAAVVIGEISFDNSGSVLAPGAKWKNLLGGKKQRRGAKPKWYCSEISEPWKTGDVLRFKIDTNTNTVVYTLTASGEKEAKAGWRFENVLAFTNIPTYPKELRAFAYCGGKGKISPSTVKLTIVDDQPLTDSMSEAIEEGSKEETIATAEPEAEPVTEESDDEMEEPADIMAETDANPVSVGQ